MRLAAILTGAGVLAWMMSGGVHVRADPEDGASPPAGDRAEPGDDPLAEGYEYEDETLTRFRKLVSGTGWKPADPPRSPQGMLEADHVGTGLTFVLVPAGSFRMGSPKKSPLKGSPPEEKGRGHDEDRRHVKIAKAFLLCRTECTQGAWERAGGENCSLWRGVSLPMELVVWETVKARFGNAGKQFRSFWRGPALPVGRASWIEVKAWCVKAGLRLPSEAEWEYACRAGTKTPFSTGCTPATDRVNFDGKHPYAGGCKGACWQRPVGCGSLPPNSWGLHEMHGNFWEWCEDTYHDSYRGAPADGSARTEGGSPYRVCRGGSWSRAARSCRSANRDWNHPSYRLFHVGFRPAASLPE